MGADTETSQTEVTSSHEGSYAKSPVVEDTTHEERSISKQRSFGQKVKAHYRKWWWLHLVVFLALTLLVVLLLVYVAFPKIAQSDVNGSGLAINSIVMSNPSEAGFHLHQVSTLTNNAAYHPQLDAFNASVAFQGQTPYAYITLPAVVASASASVIIDQDVTISNLEAFTNYTVALLNEAQVTMEVQGSTDLHEMKFPKTTVNYDKTPTINGLNKLAGFSVTNFSVLLNPMANGTNMIGTVNIPNASPITFSMGNVSMNVYNQGVQIGLSTLPDLTLYPGNNSVPMTSVTNTTAVLNLLTDRYTDGLLPVDIIGNSSVYDGAHLTYYEAALQSVTQHVTLDVGSALRAVGVNLTTEERTKHLVW